MGKTKGKIRKFLNTGFEEPVYDLYEKEIDRTNLRVVRITSLLGTLIMFILCIAALFVPSVAKVFPLYGVSCICFGILFLIARFVKKDSNHFLLLLNYGFLTVAFGFALGLDIIQKNPTATTICVLLVCMPLLVVDRPMRELSFFVLATIAFIIETNFIKQSPKASVDTLNGLSFLFIGTFLGYAHNNTVIHGILANDALQKQSDTDSLTDLFNKGAIELRATKYLKQENAKGSLIVIDMDNFKYVNDTYGHHAGDELLSGIGKVLGSLFRDTDLISRFGGDEFIAFLPGLIDKDIITRKAQQILDGVHELRLSMDPDYVPQICMGIALCPQDATDYESLFQKADTAMYFVKKHGKNGYQFFDENDKKKILVVDDVETNRAILCAILAEKWDVVEANDGIEALEILKRDHDVDLLITDIQMPRMDGLELIESIRKDSEFADLKIIANTQYGDEKQEEYAVKLGVNDFVEKPYSPTTIYLRVSNLLD